MLNFDLLGRFIKTRAESPAVETRVDGVDTFLEQYDNQTISLNKTHHNTS